MWTLFWDRFRNDAGDEHFISTGTCLFVFSCMAFLTKGSTVPVVMWNVPFVWTGVSSATWSLLITTLFGLQWRNRWLGPPTAHSSPLQLLTPQRIDRIQGLHKDIKLHENNTTKYLIKNKSVLKMFCIYAGKLRVLKDAGWRRSRRGSSADTSQESAEFDTQTKSSPFPLKGFHWRVKQQTDSQCDCLSNEKITALHLTENDLGQKDWVNKILLLQMGHWHAGACRDTPTANVW